MQRITNRDGDGIYGLVAWIVSCVLLGSVFVSCSSHKSPRKEEPKNTVIQHKLPTPSLKAPWDYADLRTDRSAELRAIEDLVSNGKLVDAVNKYRNFDEGINKNINNGNLKEIAFRGEMSTLLKLGQSKEVLARVVKFSKNRFKTTDILDTNGGSR